MSHLPSIITDLAIILIFASIFSLICKMLKQPVVLGYIVAGFLAMQFPFASHKLNTENISTWADIGVIFLLFSMGLEFSFKKLLKVGKVGGQAMLFEAITLSILGFTIGKLVGWGTTDSLLLGAMLIMSSTAIIVKAFGDLGLKKERFTQIVFGILIFEDLFAILLMVILSTLAVSKGVGGMDLIFLVLKLIFFIVIWFLSGIYVIPTLLKKTKKWLNSETLLIVSLGLCFGMVVFATSVGFSAALGAFVMGSLMAETLELERIEHVTQPIKDFFGAIFFVSVGMMVDPKILVENFWTINILAAASIFGKTIFTTIGVRLTGQSIKTSMQTGFSLAQMGEFSFIIASVGIGLGITSSFVYPIVIAVSVLTTFTTPYTMKLAIPAFNVLESTLPKKWLDKINKNQDRRAVQRTTDWGELLRSYFIFLSIFLFICIAILILSFEYLYPFASTFTKPIIGELTALAITIAAISPFIRGMIHNRGKQPFLFLSLWQQDRQNRLFLTLLIAMRYMIAFTIVFLIIWKYFHIPAFIIFLIAAIVFGVIFQSKLLLKQYWRMESRFVKNFNERQIQEKIKEFAANGDMGDTFHELDNLHWIDRHLYLTTYTVQEGGECVNKTLKEINFRSKFNVLILSILRNGKQINFPDGDFVLLKGDTMLVSGGIEHLKRLTFHYHNIHINFQDTKTLHQFASEQSADPNSTIRCMTFIVDKSSAWVGKNLMDSKVGQKSKCLVIGVERDGIPRLNPPSHYVFQEEDMLWVMGDEKSLYKLLESNLFE